MSTTRPRGDEVPEDLAEAAQACNRYDLELYRYAEELFDGAPEREELEFEVELAALRAAKAEGEIDLEVPPPDRFDGDEQLWRMVLHATAASLRNERELAESKALVEELGRREQEALADGAREPTAAGAQRGRRQGRKNASSPTDQTSPGARQTAQGSVRDASADGGARKRRRGGARGRRQRAPRSDSDRGDDGPAPDAVRPSKRRATGPGRG